ncbi:hypothetical protein P3S67_005059 [Capsicum chacoense]
MKSAYILTSIDPICGKTAYVVAAVYPNLIFFSPFSAHNSGFAKMLTQWHTIYRC